MKIYIIFNLKPDTMHSHYFLRRFDRLRFLRWDKRVGAIAECNSSLKEGRSKVLK